MTQLLYDKEWMFEQVRMSCGRYAVRAILAVPEHMHQGVLEYLVHGAKVGGFLTAVFQNDFKETCVRADHHNQVALLQWGALLINIPAFPIRSFGSKEDVEKWQALGGLLGLLKQQTGQGE